MWKLDKVSTSEFTDVFGNSENKQQRLEACVIMHKSAKYAKYLQYAWYVNIYMP